MTRLRELGIGIAGRDDAEDAAQLLEQVSSPVLETLELYLGIGSRMDIDPRDWEDMDDVLADEFFKGLKQVTFVVSCFTAKVRFDINRFRKLLPGVQAKGMLSVRMQDEDKFLSF